MIILILGCILFGEGQGTDFDASISTIDEVKIFDSEEEAGEYGDTVLNNGGDSYYTYNETDNINWNGNKIRFNTLKKEALKTFKQ